MNRILTAALLSLALLTGAEAGYIVENCAASIHAGRWLRAYSTS